MTLSARQLKTTNRLRDDYPYYAKNALLIASKAGPLVKFDFKASQHYIHKRLEEQKEKTGMVRAYIVKARQIRASSYVQGRIFHASAFTPHTKSFILTHRDDATDNLFGMSKTFLDNLPGPLQPKMLSSTGSKMVFANGSKYGLGTAASPNVGRSMTVQRFHGSEVAFWQYSDEIQTGVMQTIADVPGTEIIFESTANGPKGMFHQGVKDVLSGKDKQYIVIFIPWFWETIYQTQIPTDMHFILDDEEQHLKNIYNLTHQQLLWRRNKIISMKALWKFKQEYPANCVEAFQSSEEALIDSDAIDIARKCILTDASAPVVMGIDPASTGDRHPYVIRQGRHLLKIYEHPPMDGIRAACIAIEYVRKHNVDMIFIDTTKDLSLYDQLRATGFKDITIKVHFNERPLDDERFVNKRSEMIYKVKEWVEDSGINIPDDDALHAELICMPHDERTATGKIFFIPKTKIKKEYGMSPDVYDALALTFAYPVRRKNADGSKKFRMKQGSYGSGGQSGRSPLKTLNRHRRPDSKKKSKKILFRSAG